MGPRRRAAAVAVVQRERARKSEAAERAQRRAVEADHRVVHVEAVVRGDEVKDRKRVGPDDETNEALR